MINLTRKASCLKVNGNNLPSEGNAVSIQYGDVYEKYLGVILNLLVFLYQLILASKYVIGMCD